MKLKSSTCSCCGKPLSDPISIELGMGPICRVTEKTKEIQERTGNLFAQRSDYDYRIDGTIIAIEDLGGYKSVTNDIENVLRDISFSEKLTDFTGFKVIYKDSMGIWDGISIHPKGSVSFYSINERLYQEAKTKAVFSKQHQQ